MSSFLLATLLGRRRRLLVGGLGVALGLLGGHLGLGSARLLGSLVLVALGNVRVEWKQRQ